jgi:hypothetical protein
MFNQELQVAHGSSCCFPNAINASQEAAGSCLTETVAKSLLKCNCNEMVPDVAIYVLNIHATRWHTRGTSGEDKRRELLDKRSE